MTIKPETLVEGEDKCRYDEDRGPYITLYSGGKFYPADCRIDQATVTDIAHALALNCRYNGHVADFYSVAEHCVLVSQLVPEKYALWGLLHDVTEAFVPDIPRPLKPYIHGFQQFEDQIMEQVALRWDLPKEIPPEVKHIDRNIVRTEAEALFSDPPDWLEFYDVVCSPDRVLGLSPKAAERLWLARYQEITS